MPIHYQTVPHTAVHASALINAMFSLLDMCFGLADGVDPGQELLSVMLGCSEGSLTSWLLCWQSDGSVPEPNRAASEKNCTLAGLCGATLYHTSLYVFNLCVHPRHRGCGLGTQLLLLAEHCALENGKSFISGTVEAKHQSNLQFYTSLGAVPQETGYGHGEVPSVRFRCALPSVAAHNKVRRHQQYARARFWALAAATICIACVLLKKKMSNR
mmetsp:Transcript_12286/g.22292  ORF Transcript_12286/g.22292 Transcript_12286/m.22292 type:complete len:214 (+) Transcript_12286:43-684(+)